MLINWCSNMAQAHLLLISQSWSTLISRRDDRLGQGSRGSLAEAEHISAGTQQLLICSPIPHSTATFWATTFQGSSQVFLLHKRLLMHFKPLFLTRTNITKCHYGAKYRPGSSQLKELCFSSRDNSRPLLHGKPLVNRVWISEAVCQTVVGAAVHKKGSIPKSHRVYPSPGAHLKSRLWSQWLSFLSPL